MKISSAAQDHIKALGPKWDRALAIASMSVRQNSKLIGLDKSRQPLAIAAALAGTGWEATQGFAIPGAAGAGNAELQGVVDAEFISASDKVRAALMPVTQETAA